LHAYFRDIADARFISRKVFRLIDEHVRTVGLDPLEHQALIQLFGAPTKTLQMKDLANRLDVGSDVASKAVSSLQEKGYVRRSPSDTDRRAINVTATETGERQLAAIDLHVREHISLLQRQWARPTQLAALRMFAFYVGLAIEPDVLAEIEVRPIALTPPWASGGELTPK
jgi:DNA-binding MarR family transcriptional regulator